MFSYMLNLQNDFRMIGRNSMWEQQSLLKYRNVVGMYLKSAWGFKHVPTAHVAKLGEITGKT